QPLSCGLSAFMSGLVLAQMLPARRRPVDLAMPLEGVRPASGNASLPGGSIPDRDSRTVRRKAVSRNALADARRGQMKKKAAPNAREAPASAAASRNSATPITATIANAVQNRFTVPLLVPGPTWQPGSRRCD